MRAYQPPLATEARELKEAWTSWQQLQIAANAFLSLPAVQQALVDDVFRQSEFREDWKNRPKEVVEHERKRGGERSYAGIAERLRKAANHTQKALARDGRTEGMREMTVIQEWMNILLDGTTLHSTYETKDFFVAQRVQAIEGLTIHAVAATVKQLFVTQGSLRSHCMPAAVGEAEAFMKVLGEGPTQNPGDTLVGETHGLHVIVSHESRDIQDRILDVNPMGTAEQIRHGYSYGRDGESQLHNRVQGAWFRWLQLREYGEEQLPELAKHVGWQPPEDSVETMLGSEVLTAEALKKMTPRFFESQWGIGPKGTRLQTIDFKRGDIRRQIEFSLPMIAKAILHYPEDNPAVIQ